MKRKLTIAAVLLAGGVVAAAAAPRRCVPCGREGCAGQTVMVTDWQTNKQETVDCVKCAVELMATKFPWSRATLTAPDYPDKVALTRTPRGWTAKPETAVVVAPAAGDETCAAVRVFGSREGFVTYARQHPTEVAASRKPIPLVDYARQVAARMTPSPRTAPTSTPGRAQPVLPPAPTGQSVQPARVPPRWAAQAVDRVTQSGLMQGGPDGKFRGRDTLTRYELAEIVSRVLDRLGGTTGGATAQPAATPRSPVQEARMSASSPRSAAAGGQLTARPRPDPAALVLTVAHELTAAGMKPEAVREAVALVPQVARRSPAPALSRPGGIRVKDVPADHWAAEAVRKVLSAGLMEGYPDGTFRGAGPVTRYEIAVVLSRLLERSPGLAQIPSPGGEERPAAKPEPEQKPSPSPPPAPAGKTSVTDKLESLVHQLARQMRAAGLSQQEVDEALAPVRAEIRKRKQGSASAEEQKGAEALAALHRAQETLARLEQQLTAANTSALSNRQPPHEEASGTRSKVSVRKASADKALPFDPKAWRDETSLLGPTGLVLTPTADLQPLGQATFGASRFRGTNVTFGVAGLTNRLEVGASLTTGALPSRLLPHAKYRVWQSTGGDARFAVGLIDPFDDIDTTFYGVFTKDFSLKLGDLSPRLVSLSAGIGGGDFLDGFFGGLNVPLNKKLSLQTEIVDFGGNSVWNAGLEYRIIRELRAQVASVDGHLSGGVAYKTNF